jgi:O-glycosyl hydrolase
MIKTFRGLLADGEVDRIRLSTKKGKIGYTIKKFQVIAQLPGQDSLEATVTLSKVNFTPANAIDLSDGNILAVGFYAGNAAAFNYPTSQVLIFDQEIFNQDIFIGNNDLQSNAMNYYLELETFVQTDNQAAVSTLRDIRLNPQVGA